MGRLVLVCFLTCRGSNWEVSYFNTHACGETSEHGGRASELDTAAVGHDTERLLHLHILHHCPAGGKGSAAPLKSWPPLNEFDRNLRPSVGDES